MVLGEIFQSRLIVEYGISVFVTSLVLLLVVIGAASMGGGGGSRSGDGLVAVIKLFFEDKPTYACL